MRSDFVALRSTGMYLLILIALLLEGASSTRVIEYWSYAQNSPTIAQCRAGCAQRKGGFPATVESAAENTLVQNTIPVGWPQALLGGNRLTGDGNNFRWTEGPLGREDGGLGRKFWNGKIGTGGSCVSGTYCNWRTPTEPNNSGNNEPMVNMYQTDGKWNDNAPGSSEPKGCACKRFVITETVSQSMSPTWYYWYRAASTPTLTQCRGYCAQQPGGFLAVIMSASENARAMSVVPTSANQVMLGGNRVGGDLNNFRWTEGPFGEADGGLGTKFFNGLSLASGGSCTSGAYCNFDSNNPDNHQHSNGDEPMLYVYGSGGSRGLWNDAPITLFDSTGCLCQRPLGLTATVNLFRPPSVSRSLTKTTESFEFWYESLPSATLAQCRSKCTSSRLGGFVATIQNSIENQMALKTIPSGVQQALLGGSRVGDGTNFRWTEGPLGAANGGLGTVFYSGTHYSTGSCTSYCNWDPSQPDGVTELHVAMLKNFFGVSGQWNDQLEGANTVSGCLCQRMNTMTVALKPTASLSPQASSELSTSVSPSNVYTDTMNSLSAQGSRSNSPSRSLLTVSRNRKLSRTPSMFKTGSSTLVDTHSSSPPQSKSRSLSKFKATWSSLPTTSHSLSMEAASISASDSASQTPTVTLSWKSVSSEPSRSLASATYSKSTSSTTSHDMSATRVSATASRSIVISPSLSLSLSSEPSGSFLSATNSKTTSFTTSDDHFSKSETFNKSSTHAASLSTSTTMSGVPSTSTTNTFTPSDTTSLSNDQASLSFSSTPSITASRSRSTSDSISASVSHDATYSLRSPSWSASATNSFSLSVSKDVSSSRSARSPSSSRSIPSDSAEPSSSLSKSLSAEAKSKSDTFSPETSSTNSGNWSTTVSKDITGSVGTHSSEASLSQSRPSKSSTSTKSPSTETSVSNSRATATRDSSSSISFSREGTSTASTSASRSQTDERSVTRTNSLTDDRSHSLNTASISLSSRVTQSPSESKSWPSPSASAETRTKEPSWTVHLSVSVSNSLTSESSRSVTTSKSTETSSTNSASMVASDSLSQSLSRHSKTSERSATNSMSLHSISAPSSMSGSSSRSATAPSPSRTSINSASISLSFVKSSTATRSPMLLSLSLSNEQSLSHSLTHSVTPSLGISPSMATGTSTPTFPSVTIEPTATELIPHTGTTTASSTGTALNTPTHSTEVSSTESISSSRTRPTRSLSVATLKLTVSRSTFPSASSSKRWSLSPTASASPSVTLATTASVNRGSRSVSEFITVSKATPTFLDEQPFPFVIIRRDLWWSANGIPGISINTTTTNNNDVAPIFHAYLHSVFFDGTAAPLTYRSHAVVHLERFYTATCATRVEPTSSQSSDCYSIVSSSNPIPFTAISLDFPILMNQSNNSSSIVTTTLPCDVTVGGNNTSTPSNTLSTVAFPDTWWRGISGVVARVSYPAFPNESYQQPLLINFHPEEEQDVLCVVGDPREAWALHFIAWDVPQRLPLWISTSSVFGVLSSIVVHFITNSTLMERANISCQFIGDHPLVVTGSDSDSPVWIDFVCPLPPSFSEWQQGAPVGVSLVVARSKQQTASLLCNASSVSSNTTDNVVNTASICPLSSALPYTGATGTITFNDSSVYIPLAASVFSPTMCDVYVAETNGTLTLMDSVQSHRFDPCWVRCNAKMEEDYHNLSLVILSLRSQYNNVVVAAPNIVLWNHLWLHRNLRAVIVQLESRRGASIAIAAPYASHESANISIGELIWLASATNGSSESDLGLVFHLEASSTSISFNVPHETLVVFMTSVSVGDVVLESHSTVQLHRTASRTAFPQFIVSLPNTIINATQESCQGNWPHSNETEIVANITIVARSSDPPGDYHHLLNASLRLVVACHDAPGLQCNTELQLPASVDRSTTTRWLVEGCDFDVFPTAVGCVGNETVRISAALTTPADSLQWDNIDVIASSNSSASTTTAVLSLWLLYSIVGTTRITALNVPVDVIQVSSNISHSIELIVQHLPLLPQSTIVTLRVIDATSQLSAVLPNSVFYGFSSDTPGCPVTDRGECNLHGSCLAASMSCLCQSDNVFGHWAGAGCTTCLSGYFGSDCLGRCPGLGCSVCFGHGVCNDGLLGSGLCACDYNARNGYWSPLSDCSDCTADYYGIKCSLRCTVDPVYNLTCAGHGTCNSGISGTGSCVCNVGFASLACTTCATGYFGTQCSACPSANDEPCSGHGSCNDGIAGNGTCRCATGYTGITCSTSCPVTFNSTCGWGSCRSNGSCACPFPIAVDVASGSCSTCVEGYWGPRCNDTCNCVHGACSPSNGACTCSSGYWGPSCSHVCPGGVASPCTKHGTCNVTDGSCTCFANMSHGFYSGVRCDACNPLYNSPHCDVLCPHDPVTLVPCARRGLCYNGSCSGRCLTGLWGPNCDKECPGGELTPCSLSGTCNEDSGSCECFKGYAGAACQYSCPPGDETAPPCHNNGLCTDTAQCLCFANSSVGFWGGAACDRCAAQYTGATCNVYCNPVGGKVYENKCLCSSGYSGISCDLICPTSVDGSVCANHGMCLASNGTAVCQCAEQYYGPACEAWCTPDNCVTEFHMYRAQCNVKTGTCECLASILGNFSGPSCDKCASGFWGAECDGQCTCNGWACDRYKGTCMCSAGFGSGRWTGSTCSECAEHHIGVDCSQRNLEVSDVKTASVGVSNNGFPRRGIAFHDPKTNVLLVGSNPIATFQTEPWMTSMIPLQTISLSSAAIKCDIQNDTHLVLYLLPAGAGGADLPMVFLNRSALVSPAASNVSIGTASTATRSLLDSSRKASVLSIAPNSFELVVDTSTSCTMYFVPRINASSHSTLTIQCPNMWATPYQIPVPTTTITWMGFVGNFAVVTWSLTAGSTPSWGMYVIRYDTNSVSMVLNTTGSVVSIPECTARQGCGSVSHCIAPRLAAAANASSSIWPSNVIVCGAATALPTKNAVIFFVLDVVAGIAQTTSTVVPEATGLTAAIIDVGYNNAIFAFSGATTATLCRIQLSDPLALITLFPIERINGERPEILSMAINETTRTLWLSVGTAEAVRAVAVNLFSVRIVEPEVFDQLGGVTVTVTGLGFVPSPTPLCDFHSKMTATSPSISSAPAVYINSTTLLCRAAEVSAYDTNCATLSLNVWYGERVTRTTLAGTSRPLSVTLDAATTTESGGLSSSRHLLSSTITLTGFGFVLGATAATCRIEEANGDVVAVLQAIPLGATEALCVQHSGGPSTHRGSVIRYSHDAFVYSESSTPFTVVGEWAGFSVHPTSVTLQSAPKSLAPAVTVYSVDSNGNSLLLLDSGVRDVICSSIAPALLVDALAPQLLLDPSTINVVATMNGTAPFSKIVLATPFAGIMTIYFFTRLDLTISTTLRITVTPGLPSKITFSPGTSPMSWTSGVTTAFTIPSFSVVVKDVAGNVVIGGGSVALPREITVNYVNVLPVTPSPNETRTSVETPVAFTSTANSRTSAYDFGGLSLRSPFAVDVTLRFTCVDANITALTFTVPQESCGSGRYGERGAYECFLCPAHASCDGSTSIDADPGYWRGSITSPYLYACSPAEGCRSSTECAAGYIGALCGSCALGFGRTVSTCDACTSTVVPWVFVALIVVGLVVLVWGLGLRSVAFSAPADVDARVVDLPAKRSAVPVVIKLALSHVQILALLPLRRLAVGFIGDALESSGSWSVVTPGFLNVACVIGRRAFNEMIATVALVGLVIVGCIVLAVLIAKRDNGRFRDEARRQAAKQRAKLAKDAQASPMRFRAADVAHTAALFRSSKNRVEVLRNHFHLIDEYDGDVLARHQIAPHDFQGWLEADIEVDEKEDAKFIALEELVAPVAPDGVPPAYIRRPAVWTRVVNITLISIVVTTFLLYPTVVQAAVRTMQCHAVRISNAVSISVLSYDPVVECTSSEYHSGQLPAVAVLVAFGAGVPLLCPLVILFARRFTCGGRLDRACQLFFFVTGGYRVWFWEGLVLARKAVIVVVLVLMADDDQASCIICMWVLAGCLALNATQRPWEAQRLGSLEALSLATLSLTSLCLAALAGSPDVSTAWSLAQVVVVAVMNILVGVAVAFMFVTAAADEIAEVIPEEAFGLKALRIASLQRNKRNMLSDIEQAHSRAARISSAATATLGALNHLADEDLEVTTEAEVISLRRGGSSNGSSSCNLKGSTQSGKGRLNSAESTSFRLTSESSFDPLDDQPIAERAVVFSRQGPRGSRPGVGLQQLRSPPPQLRPPSRDRLQSSFDELPGSIHNAFKRNAPQRVYEHYWDEDVELDDTLTAIVPAPSPPTAIRRSSLLTSNQLRHSVATLFYEDIELSENALDSPRLGVEELQYDDDISVSAISDEEEKYAARSPRTRVGLEALPSPAKLNPLPASFYGDVDLSDDDSDTTVRSVVIDVARPLESPAVEDSAPPPVVAPVESAELLELGRHSSSTLHRRLWKLWAFLPRQLLALEADLQLSSVDTSNSPAVVMLTQLSLCRRQRQLLNALYDLELALTKKLAQHEEPAPVQLGRKLRRAPRSPPVQNPVSHPQTTSHGWQEGNWDEVQPSGGGDHVIDQFDI